MKPTSAQRSSGHAEGGLWRIRLDVSYDGTPYAGWAIQPDQRTVAGELTAALAQVTRVADVALTVAGRTDAGVHATGQVAHMDIPGKQWELLPGRSKADPATSLITRLAGVLPPTIVVRAATVVDSTFDARFSAVARRYRYRLSDSIASRSPTRTTDVVWLPPKGPLDVVAMNNAAEPLLGEHNWLPYCRPRAGASTIRTLQQFSWERQESGLVVGQVQADAFCHHMVRALVGACVAVGAGRREPTWPREVLDAGVRDSAVTVMPAHGLTLEEVTYPSAQDWAAQAQAARRRRDEPACSQQ